METRLDLAVNSSRDPELVTDPILAIVAKKQTLDRENSLAVLCNLISIVLE